MQGKEPKWTKISSGGEVGKWGSGEGAERQAIAKNNACYPVGLNVEDLRAARLGSSTATTAAPRYSFP